MTFSSVRCVKINFITETSWTHFTCKWFISVWWIDLSFPGFKRMIQWVMSEMSDHSSLISLMSDDEWRMIEMSEMSELSDEWRNFSLHSSLISLINHFTHSPLISSTHFTHSPLISLMSDEWSIMKISLLIPTAHVWS